MIMMMYTIDDWHKWLV